MWSRASAAQLGLVRAVVFGSWLVIVLRTPVGGFTELPPELFAAPGPLSFLLPDSEAVAGSIASPPVLLAFKALLIVLCALAALGTGPYRLVAVAAAALVLAFDWLMKGYLGYINHAQFALLYAALILAFAPAADGFRLVSRGAAPPRRAPQAYSAALVAVALTLSLTYTFVGTHRLVHGGIELFTSAAANSYLAVQGSMYSGRLLPHGALLLEHAGTLVLFKTGFAVATVFEILAPLALISRRFRWAWVPVIGLFHLSTLALMGIFFWENLLLVAVLFTPVGQWIASRVRPRGRAPEVLPRLGDRSDRPPRPEAGGRPSRNAPFYADSLLPLTRPRLRFPPTLLRGRGTTCC